MTPDMMMRVVRAAAIAAEGAARRAIIAEAGQMPDGGIDGLIASALCEAYVKHYGPFLAGDAVAIQDTMHHVGMGLLTFRDADAVAASDAQISAGGRPIQ